MSYLLSININTYNNESSIIRTIKSIPVRNDIQIVIVNDGSTDNTHQVIMDYLKQKPENQHVTYLIHKVNAGVGAARKTAQQYIKGKYFTAIGADDWFHTKELNELLNNWVNRNHDLIFFNMSRNKGYSTKIMNEGNWKLFCGSVKLIKTEFIKKNNIQWHAIRCGEDFDFDRQYWYLNPTRIFSKLTVKHWNRPNETHSNITVHGASKKSEIVSKTKEYKKTYNAQILAKMKLMKNTPIKLGRFKPNFKEESSEVIVIQE